MKNSEKKKAGACRNSYKSLDMYGEPISLTFQNDSKYKTTLGATISLVCYVTLLSFLMVRTYKLISMEDPFFSVAPVARRIQDHPLDLYDLGFMFATSSIKPEVGRLKVEFIQHHI